MRPGCVDVPLPGEAARNSLRDALRSARRWQELLSEEERRRLLADIARVALAIGRDLYPERGVEDLDIHPAKGGDPCPRERLAFLAAAWRRIAPALHAIEAAPYEEPVPRTRSIAPERARRVAAMALLQAVRLGDFLPAPPGIPLARRLNGHLPRRITEKYAALTHDTLENRTVKACLAHFARDLAALAALAQALQAPEVGRDALELRARIRRHLLRAPWQDLPPLEKVPCLTPTLRAHPHYRLVHDVYRRYRQSFRFDWDNPLFSLPARETWLLYEYWGFFQVASVLRELGYGATRARSFALLRSGLRFSLARGTASRLEFAAAGQTVSLTYNREFSRDASRADGWRCRSHTMRPDITLETGRRLLLLDTKFKTYAEPGWEADDIHQMHAYRDAIAYDDERNVVSEAWLLYAGRGAGGNRSVIAYPASTPGRPYGAGDVGALLLRPCSGTHHLTQVIARFLKKG